MDTNYGYNSLQYIGRDPAKKRKLKTLNWNQKRTQNPTWKPPRTRVFNNQDGMSTNCTTLNSQVVVVDSHERPINRLNHANSLLVRLSTDWQTTALCWFLPVFVVDRPRAAVNSCPASIPFFFFPLVVFCTADDETLRSHLSLNSRHACMGLHGTCMYVLFCVTNLVLASN